MKTDTLVAIGLAVVAALLVVRFMQRAPAPVQAPVTADPTAGYQDGGY